MNEHRNRLLATQVGWMMTTLLILLLLQAFSYELFFVMSLIGLLVATEQSMSFRVTPDWQRRLYWVIALGLIGLVYIVVRRVLALLPEGLI